MQTDNNSGIGLPVSLVYFGKSVFAENTTFDCGVI